MMTRTARVDITFPKESEVRAAVQGRRELTAYLATNFETQRIQILDDRNVGHQIELPTSALRLLVDILAEFVAGNGVGIVPMHPELTTQEAADLLLVRVPTCDADSVGLALRMESNWFSGLDSNQQCLESKARCSTCTATADRNGSGGWNRTTVRESSKLGRDASNPRLNKLAGRLGLEPSKVGFGDQPPRLRSTQILAERTVAATDTLADTSRFPGGPGSQPVYAPKVADAVRVERTPPLEADTAFKAGEHANARIQIMAEGGRNGARPANRTPYLPGTNRAHRQQCLRGNWSRLPRVDHFRSGTVSLHVWCQSKDLRLPVILTKDATRYLVLTGKMARRE